MSRGVDKIASGGITSTCPDGRYPSRRFAPSPDGALRHRCLVVPRRPAEPTASSGTTGFRRGPDRSAGGAAHRGEQRLALEHRRPPLRPRSRCRAAPLAPVTARDDVPRRARISRSYSRGRSRRPDLRGGRAAGTHPRRGGKMSVPVRTRSSSVASMTVTAVPLQLMSPGRGRHARKQ